MKASPDLGGRLDGPTPSEPDHRRTGFVGRLTDQRLLVRFAALFTVAAALFLTCWFLAYLLLPTGLLRGRTGGAVLAGGDQVSSSFTGELLRLLAVNLSIATLVIVMPNVLRNRRGVPMGYWSALTMVAVAAVVTGTNSFSIQVGSPAKVAPSFELLANPGPYELAAYVLAAVATSGIGRWQIEGRWPHSTAHRIALRPLPVTQTLLGLGIAATMLVVTAVWEANRILATVG